MSRSERDATRIVSLWLEEGATALPDRVLDAVLDQLPATPQRPPSWLARRLPLMNNNMVRFGIAAVAVIAIALLGIRFLPVVNPGGAVPTPTASPIPSPWPSRMQEGALEPGTYSVTRFTSRAFAITVPEGWSHDLNFVGKGDVWNGSGVTFATWLVSHVYADSCRWDGTLREVGSAAELVNALAEQTGHQTSGPTDVSLGGYPTTSLEFSVPADFDVSVCDSEFMRLWPDAGPNQNYGLPINAGQRTTVYVVDVDGRQPMLVVAIRKEDSSAVDVAELQRIVDSIQFLR